MKNNLALAKAHDNMPDGSEILTVVMIHGIASDAGTYGAALEYLENMPELAGVRFVTFDLLGSGSSSKDDELDYDYADQLEALNNAISDLGSTSPLVLVGHSLGTFIVTRYAKIHPKSASQLILVSPPVYIKEDFDNPIFAAGIEMFKKSVSAKNPQILEEKSFKNSMEKIVLDRENYDVLASIEIPTVLVYGDEDPLIGAQNIPGIVELNKNLTAIKTSGRHSVTQDKYEKIGEVLKDRLDKEK